MKKFRDFKEDLTCPVGMKYDKKLKSCVPIKSTYHGRWWGGGRHHEKQLTEMATATETVTDMLMGMDMVGMVMVMVAQGLAVMAVVVVMGVALKK